MHFEELENTLATRLSWAMVAVLSILIGGLLLTISGCHAQKQVQHLSEACSAGKLSPASPCSPSSRRN
ncbi:MAG TPA: hypothetical protein VGI79_01825 [Caulobacteraceae bacterium]|jgi:hypothetical protein